MLFDERRLTKNHMKGGAAMSANLLNDKDRHRNNIPKRVIARRLRRSNRAAWAGDCFAKPRNDTLRQMGTLFRLTIRSKISREATAPAYDP